VDEDAAMVQTTLDISDETLASLRQDPEGFAQEMRLAAAVKWYEVQRISQERAAEIAGLSRHDFLLALSRFGVSPFQESIEELRAEARGE